MKERDMLVVTTDEAESQAFSGPVQSRPLSQITPVNTIEFCPPAPDVNHLLEWCGCQVDINELTGSQLQKVHQ